MFGGEGGAWLRAHWRSGNTQTLTSSECLSEVIQVLAYPKFGLSQNDIEHLLQDYLPYAEVAEVTTSCPVRCRDQDDQKFLDLAQSHDCLIVSGDSDLLSLKGQTDFEILTLAEYRQRFN